MMVYHKKRSSEPEKWQESETGFLCWWRENYDPFG
jgi:hypothetical protein